MNDKRMLIDYTNHRGERNNRRIVPQNIWFGVSPYHEGAQWFLRAYDMGKFAERDFALSDIHGMSHVESSAAA